MGIAFWILVCLLLITIIWLGSAGIKIRDLTSRNEKLRDEKNSLQLKNVELSSTAESSQKMEERFDAMAQRIFQTNQETFQARSEKSVEALLKPFGENMKDFKDKVELFNRGSRDSYIDLSRQIKDLSQVNLTLNEQALNLTKALKGNSKLRGDWGEERLGRILEDSGFQEGRDYDKQFSYVDEEGAMKRPDCVVRLPQNRNIIIDSKVSLVDYTKYQDSNDNPQKERHLKSHVLSIRNHVKELSRKNYGDLGASLDQVLMFVPIEPALMLALDKDSNLEHEALDANVWLTSPSTLQWALKIISFMWIQERQTKNVLDIAEAGGRVHDQVVLVAESLDKVGNSIEKAKEYFEKTKGRLTTGKGNLISQVDKLKGLGAKTKRQIPKEFRYSLLESSQEQDTEN